MPGKALCEMQSRPLDPLLAYGLAGGMRGQMFNLGQIDTLAQRNLLPHDRLPYLRDSAASTSISEAARVGLSLSSSSFASTSQ